MKKALQISIAKTIFTIEEDAYAMLEKYLNEVKEHFKSTEGSDEIVSDIENRIAEQLLESGEKIVSLPLIQKVVDTMGKVEDFGDSGDISSEEEPKSDKKNPLRKKLYRNPDDLLIGGVCSGLGAYFGVDPVWVRLFFVVLTLFSGFGIVAYIVLWIVVPEAKTNSQKLEMTGSPITLETLSETVKERVEEVKSHNHGPLRRLVSLPFRILAVVFKFIVKAIFPIARILVGIVLSVVGLGILVGVLITGGFLISGEMLIDGVSLQTLLPGVLSFIATIGVIFVVVIPAFFVFVGGLSLLQKRSVLNTGISLSFLGIWFIAIIISGFGVAKVVSNYERLTQTSPEYQTTTQVIPITEEFGSIQVSNGLDVEIKKSTTTEVVLTGSTKNMDSVETTVENGKLTIKRIWRKNNSFCIFCFNRAPEVTVYVPEINDIVLTNGSHLELADTLDTASLSLELVNGSSANVTAEVKELKLRLAQGSHLNLKGKSVSLDVLLKNGSNLNADELEVENTIAVLEQGSSADIWTTKTLDVTLRNGSNLEYKGTPTVTQKIDRGSSLQSLDEIGSEENWD